MIADVDASPVTNKAFVGGPPFDVFIQRTEPSHVTMNFASPSPLPTLPVRGGVVLLWRQFDPRQVVVRKLDAHHLTVLLQYALQSPARHIVHARTTVGSGEEFLSIRREEQTQDWIGGIAQFCTAPELVHAAQHLLWVSVGRNLMHASDARVVARDQRATVRREG
eukprot:881848-Prymnesium_polylepis.1